MELVYNKSKPVAVTGMAFPAGDVNNYVVGSEEGMVYSASRHGRLVSWGSTGTLIYNINVSSRFHRNSTWHWGMCVMSVSHIISILQCFFIVTNECNLMKLMLFMFPMKTAQDVCDMCVSFDQPTYGIWNDSFILRLIECTYVNALLCCCVQ